MTITDDGRQTTRELTERLADELIGRRQSMATAESCTGGLIAAACTEIAGSSRWFDRGYVTYTNDAKQQDLGVAESLLDAHGAVSQPAVAAMTAGALVAAPATEWAVAVSGVAGPGGGSADKPVGTVFIGWQQRRVAATVQRVQLAGDRAEVRRATVRLAMLGLIEAIRGR